jgi:multiple RNA-binding domain-containing protein 1
VDHHAWTLKFSKRNIDSSNERSLAQKPIKAHGTKLLVRNVPFEASKRELRDLLSTFGQIKTIRLPKKFTGEHRGFCFVDFLTEQEAKHAFEGLTNTHFYGRHLVIEWAEDDDSLGSLREKTAKRFILQEKDSSKRIKLDMKDQNEEEDDDDDDPHQNLA